MKRSVALIAGGAAGGQLIALACSPLISRLVLPAEYGMFAIINGLIMPLVSISALRLEAAVPLPQNDDEALDLVRTGLASVTTMTLVGTVIVWLAKGHLVDLTRLDVLPELLVWAPLIAGLMGVFVLLNQLAIRSRQYGAIGARNVLQGAVTGIGQVLFAALGWGAHGLALGLALGQAVGAFSLWVSLGSIFAKRSQRPARLRGVISRYRSFPLLMMPSALINSLGLQVPLLLVAAIHGTGASGWMGMTQRVLAIPLALIGTAIAQVFLGEFSAAKRSKTTGLEILFLRTSKRLALVGTLLAIGIALLGPTAFSLVLGEQWRMSGIYARCLALGFVFQMVASPLSQTLIVMKKLVWQFLWDIFRLIACCMAVLVPGLLGMSDVLSLSLLGGVMGIAYLVLWVISWRAVRGQE
ncbi:lipopolysaccharide biosynthesis protein [Luteococcus sp. OSA5]|uniref:lipopolysaccharide biosynthesis protein n=1 Tax=Luteococcus sp. OSA5 TaxID=3401630 RepID=UPI003B429A74